MGRFTESDLIEFEDFLNYTSAVVPYIDVARGLAPPGSIAMRHDVDHDIVKARRFAEWEELRGFRSSYYILTTAGYYNDKEVLFNCLDAMIDMGHEIGFHNDALSAMDGDVIAAADHIRVERKVIEDGLYRHYSLLGVADHGNRSHVNSDIWKHFTPEALGFEYEAYKLQRSSKTYISDNRGEWSSPLSVVQTYVLTHPIWWPI